MRVHVTGAGGFVGRWLTQELRSAGHEVTGAGPERVEITDRAAVRDALLEARPDAVVHLAAVAFAPDAAADPAAAFRVNAGGTLDLVETLRSLPITPVVLVAGSSEVYGRPDAGALPLAEDAPLAPRTPYALSKAAAEAIALAHAARFGAPVAVARAFNHTGPGQRPVFVVPALARRVLAVRDGAADRIPAGNLDVRRDLSDVRDVARAYRLVIEALREGTIAGGTVVNVASGRATLIRDVVERFAALAGVEPRIEVDPALVRPDDPPVIVGDATRLRTTVGWEPTIPLEQTLADVWASVTGEVASDTPVGSA